MVIINRSYIRGVTQYVAHVFCLDQRIGLRVFNLIPLLLFVTGYFIQIHMVIHAASEEEEYHYSDTITVTADTMATGMIDIKAVPNSITIIKIDEKAPPAVTVAEVISASVGVTVQDFGGAGKLKTVSIRGTSANQVVVLLDGIKLNTAAQGSVDLSNIPIQEIDHIEIIRGGGSEQVGSGAMGGVINIVTKQSQENRTTVTAQAGSFETGELGITQSLKTKRFRTLLHLNGFHTTGDYEFLNDHGMESSSAEVTKEKRTNNFTHSGGALLKFTGQLPHEYQLSLISEWYRAKKGIPGMVTFPSPHAREFDERLMLNLSLQRHFANTGSLFLSTHAIQTAIEFEDPSGEQTGVPIDTNQTDTNAGMALQYSILPLTWCEVDCKVEAANERLNDSAYGIKKRNSSAVMLTADCALIRSRLWFTPALRYDKFQGSDEEYSPRLGLLGQLTKRIALSATIGRTFRAPTFNELYMSSGFVVGNPQLESEHGITKDVGIRLHYEQFMSELTYFDIETTNLIQYVLLSRFQFKPLNIGRARSQGIEWQGSWSPVSPIHLSANYTYTKSEDKSGDPLIQGKQIPGHPMHDVFFRAEAEYWKAKPFVEYQFLSGNFLTRSNSKRLADRFSINTGVKMQLTKNLNCGLEVKNLTNEYAQDVRGFPLPSRSIFLSGTLSY